MALVKGLGGRGWHGKCYRGHTAFTYIKEVEYRIGEIYRRGECREGGRGNPESDPAPPMVNKK